MSNSTKTYGTVQNLNNLTGENYAKEIKAIDVFGVYRNSDMIEGRGADQLLLVFENETDAWDYADTLCGVAGCRPAVSWRHEKYPSVKVRPLKVVIGSCVSKRFKEKCDMMVVVHDEQDKKKREALEKLTPEDIKILGIKI